MLACALACLRRIESRTESPIAPATTSTRRTEPTMHSVLREEADMGFEPLRRTTCRKRERPGRQLPLSAAQRILCSCQRHRRPDGEPSTRFLFRITIVSAACCSTLSNEEFAHHALHCSERLRIQHRHCSESTLDNSSLQR